VQESAPSAVVPVLAAAAAAFASSAVLTRALVTLGKIAATSSAMRPPGQVKDELRPVPNVGGISIAASVLGPLAALLAAAAGAGADRLAEWAPSLGDSARRMADTARPAGAILLGALVLHVLGVVDDRRALRPWPKLAVQVGVAAAVAWFGGVRALTLLDAHAGGPWLSVLLTTAFFVAVANAVNFLDNMDGLAGGVSAIAAAALCVAACVARQWATAGVLALLAGALLGFLVFNFPWRAGLRARIFMGDGGSLPVGFLLAALAVQITFTAPGEAGYALGTRWYGVLSPLVILAVPLYDAFTVSVLRLVQGKSPMVGDQQHFSHRLVMRGLSRRGAVLLICALAATCGVSGLLLGTAAPWQAVLIGVQVTVVLATIAALERPMLARMAEDRR